MMTLVTPSVDRRAIGPGFLLKSRTHALVSSFVLLVKNNLDALGHSALDGGALDDAADDGAVVVHQALSRVGVVVLVELRVLVHALGESKGGGERLVQGKVQVLLRQNLVRRPVVGGNVREGVGHELDEPVLGDEEAVLGPEEQGASSHDGDGGHQPQVGDGNVVPGEERLGASPLGELNEHHGGEREIQQHDLHLLGRVEAEHRLLLVVARRLENVVARLADDQGEEAPVDRAAVVDGERRVAPQKDRGRPQVEVLVDQVGVRRLVVDLLLAHDAAVELRQAAFGVLLGRHGGKGWRDGG
mmetsp:Transcript_7225/g.14327  ORF Transcript_7225/g.14327 Transcript_7225/m.14327 type:complete len:301 (-) Transcript_7225:18-920(-)